MFREELADLLRDDHHEVTTSPSAVKALEELARQEFDVVLTDLKMPRQSGLDLLREVRARFPATPVVMITGFATVETAVEAMKSGAADYVQKPFKIDQVRQVLGHIEQEGRFLSGEERAPSPDQLVRGWVRENGSAVLYLTPREVRPVPGVTVQRPDLENPAAMRDAIEAFLAERPRAGVLLEDVDRMLLHHRRSDILAFLEDIRQRMEGRGPFVVTFNPKRISAADARDVRAAVVGPATRLTLEALANPVRRAVLRRAADGACSFTEAMRAAGLEDSPKLAFHLRRLVDDGLLVHGGENYRITAKGTEAMRLLSELDELARFSGMHNGAIPLTPVKGT